MAGEQQSGDKVNGGAGGETLEKLQGQMGEMKTQMEQLAQTKTELEKRLEGADKELLSPEYLDFLESKRGGDKRKDGEKGATKEEKNLDEMSPKELAEYLSSKHKGDLEATVKEITKRMDSIGESLVSTYAQIDLNLVCVRNSDLDAAMNTPPANRTEEQKELVNTMYAVAKENPGWNATKCLKQARLEIKASAEDKGEKEREREETERKALTEKGGLPNSASQQGSLSKDKAAELAWKNTFGNAKSVERI